MTKSSSAIGNGALEGAADGKPDVGQIMARIRAKIRADVEANRDKLRPLAPCTANQDANTQRKAGELVYSEDRRYVNAHFDQIFWTQLKLDSVVTHRTSRLGRFIVNAKRKLLVLVWEHILKERFRAERDYQHSMVRYMNEVSSYVDARDSANFWELIRKIDYDVTKVMERVERVSDEQSAALRTLERRVFDGLEASLADLTRQLGATNAAVAKQEDRINVLSGVADGLERITARIGRGALQVREAEQSLSAAEQPDFSYLLLENRFRGSEEEIAKRLSIYPEYFTGSSKPVLEIGGGRGELQSLFRERGVASYNVDIDRAMVETAGAKGLDARLGDGVAHLRSLDDASLGGVIAIQVVEHLTRSQLEELFRLCSRKVAPGGRIVFETINPRSLLALSSNYFRDPTHIWPLHPDTLSYSMSLAGLKVTAVRMLSPVPSEAMLREIPIEEHLTPRWRKTVEAINANVRHLNELLYGHQDYCIVAEAAGV